MYKLIVFASGASLILSLGTGDSHRVSATAVDGGNTWSERYYDRGRDLPSYEDFREELAQSHRESLRASRRLAKPALFLTERDVIADRDVKPHNVVFPSSVKTDIRARQGLSSRRSARARAWRRNACHRLALAADDG